MKQVEVTILGQSYILGCPDDGERELLQAVAMVDREMSTIRDAGKIKARERIAVLAALNLAYRLAEQEGRSIGRSDAGPGEPQAATAASSAAAASSSLNGGSQPIAADLQALIARLDTALGEDGRLL